MRAFPPVEGSGTDVASKLPGKRRGIREIHTSRPDFCPPRHWRMGQGGCRQVQEFRKTELPRVLSGQDVFTCCATIADDPLSVRAYSCMRRSSRFAPPRNSSTNRRAEGEVTAWLCNTRKCCTKRCARRTLRSPTTPAFPSRSGVIGQALRTARKLVRLVRGKTGGRGSGTRAGGGGRSGDAGRSGRDGRQRRGNTVSESKFELKPISKEAIRGDSEAERLCLINQSWGRRSICREILEIDRQTRTVW